MSFQWIRTIFVACIASLIALPAASQQVYGTKDAQYVTSSRNDFVLRYIACLELVASTLPSSMSIESKLKRGETDCANAAALLPNSSSEPDAAGVRAMILECGFRPGDASPDADCGVAGSPANPFAANGPALTRPAVADDVTLTPRVIELGKWIEGIAYDGASLWAAESGQRTIAKVDLAIGNLVKRFNVGRLPIAIATTGGDDVFTLVATDKLIVKHDKRGRKSTFAKLGDCPSAMVPSGADLFVLGEINCTSDGSRVVRVDSAGAQTKSSDLGEWAQAMTAVGSELWVGHARGAAISILDRQTLRVSKQAIPGVEVWALAANSKAVFAGGRHENTDSDGSVVMLDARSRREISRFSVTELVAAMVADETHLAVVGGKGTIWLFSARDMTLLRTIHLSTGEFQARSAILANGDLLISASTYRGENGAVFVLEDYLPPAGVVATTQPVRPTFNIQRPTFNAQPNRPTFNTRRPTFNARPSGSTTFNAQPNRPAFGGQPNRPRGIVQPGRPAVAAGTGFPVQAGSFGGRVRSGPGIAFSSPGSVADGEPIVLIEKTGVLLDGFPWFRIAYENGKSGYQWGGIICSVRVALQGTSGICPLNSAATLAATASPGLAGRRPQFGNNNSIGRPNRPQFGSNNSGRGGASNFGRRPGGANANDVVIGFFDLLGKVIDNNGNKGAATNNNTTRGNTNATPGRSNNSPGVSAVNPNLFLDTINVAVGGSVTKSRSLNPGQLAVYTLSAKRGQVLRVEAVSPARNAVFAIFIGRAVSGGATLQGAGENDNATLFDGQAEVTGEYQIVVGSTSGQTSYQLIVGLRDFVPGVAQPGGTRGTGTGLPNPIAGGTLGGGTRTATNRHRPAEPSCGRHAWQRHNDSRRNRHRPAEPSRRRHGNR